MSLAMASSMAFAQTYKLAEMSAETFASGGDAQWSFQKYEYGTGVYTKFAQYGTESTCNFLDQYQPERVMGELIASIDGYTTDDANNYWAGTLRNAWYDLKYESPNSNSADKFIYMTQDFETFANPKYAGVVSFTVPEDGYYKVDGTIVRQDCFKFNPLYLVPRFRQQGVEQVDSAITMGLAFAYGDNGGEVEGWKNVKLSEGAEPRFIPQTPTDYSFSFYGKKGDVVSFEANASKYYLNYSFSRDCYGRTFFKKLDIEKVDKAVAEADNNYCDPYDMTGVDDFKKRLDECDATLTDIMANPDLIGDGWGQYTNDAVDEAYDLITKFSFAVTSGQVNAMNLEVYKAQFEAEWQKFLDSKASIDYKATGNYVLFTDNSNLDIVKLPLDQNSDTPFGYYWYDTNAGVYNKFETWTKTKGGVDGWCRNNGEWMYLQQDGTLHPDVARTPAILFTAPADGMYNVGISLYRTNPNQKVENPLYLRTRYVTNADGVLSCPKSQEMYSKQYGSVANDGMQGKAPIDLDFYVNLKQGDVFSADFDCYTSGRNSSAGTQITRFVVASMLGEDTPITKEFAESTGLPIFDPYKLADMTSLQALLDSANTIKTNLEGKIGEEEGQYAADSYTAFNDCIAKGEGYVANAATATQVEVDAFCEELKEMITQLYESRKPFSVAMSETTAIRLAGTNKYLVQKDAASDHYYAAFMSMDDIIAAVAKGASIDDYKWTFTVNAHADGGYYLTNENGVLTADGYVGMLPPNPTDDYAAARLNFVTEEKGDTLVAITRCSDNKYWQGSFTWRSPYDKINQSSKPVFAFVLGDAPAITPSGIDNMQAGAAGDVKTVEYYAIDGRRLSALAKGIVLKRTVAADGTVNTMKIVVK